MSHLYPKFKSASTITGSTSGVFPAEGIIGETISSGLAGPSPVSAGNITSLTNIELEAGDYLLIATGAAISSSALSSLELGIGTIINSYSGVSLGLDKVQINAAGPVFSGCVTKRVSISSTTNYYLTFNCGFSSGTTTIQGNLDAIRIG